MSTAMSTRRTLRTLLAVVVLGLALGSAACSNSVCPFPNGSTVTIDPPQACLETKVSSCVRPTLDIVNKCPEALYLPIDYGVFPADAMAGSEIEVLPNATIHYEARDDKATSTTASRKDFEIPGRLGSTKLTFRFNTSAEKK
jgi:hypothetical protein